MCPRSFASARSQRQAGSRSFTAPKARLRRFPIPVRAAGATGMHFCWTCTSAGADNGQTQEHVMNEREVFINALERQNAADRSGYLDRVCAGNASLRRRVEVLLRAHERAGNLLQRPAVEQFA